MVHNSRTQLFLQWLFAFRREHGGSTGLFLNRMAPPEEFADEKN
jgi:hypothetical protein